jgi:hypothetical protein
MSQSEGALLEELWTRWVAGQSLDEPDRAALMAGVEQNEVFRRRVVHDWQMQNALQAAAKAEHDRKAVVARVKAAVRRVHAAGRDGSLAGRAWAGARRWSGPRAVVAAAAVAGALGLLLVWPRAGQRDARPARARSALVTSLAGQVTMHRPAGSVAGKLGLALGAGDSLSTVGVGSRATLSYGDGPRLELGPDSALTVLARGQGDANVVVFHGSLTGTGDSAEGPGLHLGTPHATVIGRGRISLEVSARQTSIQVHQGKARVVVASSARESELFAGQSATVRPEPSGARLAAAAPEALLLVTFAQEGGPTALSETDRLLKDRLEGLGYSVTVLEPDDASEEDLSRSKVVVLSFTVTAAALPPTFMDLATPIVAIESSAFTELRFTGPRWAKDVGTGPKLTDIEITDPGHPLAAGFSGAVRVMTRPLRVRWAAPPPAATSVASYAGAPEEKTLVFAYDRGDATAGGPAPARRVGLFLGNEQIVRSLNEQGWRLFDAAVTWCVAGAR